MLLFWKSGSGWSLCRGAVEERWLIKTGLHIQPVSSSSVGTKRRSLRMRVPKKMRQNWRKRTSSIARCFLPATRRPACRHHISLKLLPLAQLPGAGVANVSVSNLGRRPVSMVTAAAGLYEDYPAALTLEHMQWPCDLVCVCVQLHRCRHWDPGRVPHSPVCQVCSFVFVLLPFLVYGCWAASLCLLLASSLSVLVRLYLVTGQNGKMKSSVCSCSSTERSQLLGVFSRSLEKWMLRRKTVTNQRDQMLSTNKSLFFFFFFSKTKSQVSLPAYGWCSLKGGKGGGGRLKVLGLIFSVRHVSNVGWNSYRMRTGAWASAHALYLLLFDPLKHSLLLCVGLFSVKWIFTSRDDLWLL